MKVRIGAVFCALLFALGLVGVAATEADAGISTIGKIARGANVSRPKARLMVAAASAKFGWEADEVLVRLRQADWLNEPRGRVQSFKNDRRITGNNRVDKDALHDALCFGLKIHDDLGELPELDIVETKLRDDTQPWAAQHAFPQPVPYWPTARAVQKEVRYIVEPSKPAVFDLIPTIVCP